MTLKRKILRSLIDECPELQKLQEKLLAYGYLKDILVVETEKGQYYAMYNSNNGKYENLKEYELSIKEHLEEDLAEDNKEEMDEGLSIDM